ncbi:MAG: type III-A CRISPR-associated RAMP protein Csm5, partial [Acidobacteria bacterium]|nr:type III-A CRISPR-associated RAMP protein Csm5 [Acidobacteriota bacterium]
LTCLTPLLVGDGHKLSPIDYMVWKDQVNVLDQRRIFRLLAKGPRLESYLTQLKRADKLDFASWGGFAQNFADRRIAFEHPSLTTYWERAKGDSLQIPTFISSPDGPYLPGSALKGALRTGMLFAHWKGSLPQSNGRFQRPGEAAEEQALGAPGSSLMRAFGTGDSQPVSTGVMKLYLLRASTLQARGPEHYELGWKQAPRGTVDNRHIEDSTPLFAEMASPGTTFEGVWRENQYLAQPEVLKALRWREPVTSADVFRNANKYAAELLGIQRQYAVWAGLPFVEKSISDLEGRLNAVRDGGTACLVSLGWGSGLLAKTPWLDTKSESYRQALSEIPLYSSAIRSGLPFPKTRRIVFLGNQAATLPGWALLELTD